MFDNFKFYWLRFVDSLGEIGVNVRVETNFIAQNIGAGHESARR